MVVGYGKEDFFQTQKDKSIRTQTIVVLSVEMSFSLMVLLLKNLIGNEI